MPQMNVKTISAENVWSTPDGSKTIYKLMLDYDGRQVSAKTYSNAIATVGWSGTVETYEKQGRQGAETFVKQPQKEWSGGGGYQKSSGQSGGVSKAPHDNYTMFLSYVKDIAVALINSKAYTAERLNEVATDVATAGEMFYAMRPDAPKDVVSNNADKVVDVTDDMLDNASNLDDVLGGDLLSGESDPWSPN